MRKKAPDNEGYRVHYNPDDSWVFFEPARPIRALWTNRDSRTLDAYWRDRGFTYVSWRETLAGLEWSEEFPRTRSSHYWAITRWHRRRPVSSVG